MQKGKAKKSKTSFQKNWPHNTMKDRQIYKTQTSSNVDIKEQRSRLIVLSTSK